MHTDEGLRASFCLAWFRRRSHRRQVFAAIFLTNTLQTCPGTRLQA